MRFSFSKFYQYQTIMTFITYSSIYDFLITKSTIFYKKNKGAEAPTQISDFQT